MFQYFLSEVTDHWGCLGVVWTIVVDAEPVFDLSAHELCHLNIISKLSTINMIAHGAKYHLRCLAALVNHPQQNNNWKVIKKKDKCDCYSITMAKLILECTANIQTIVHNKMLSRSFTATRRFSWNCQRKSFPQTLLTLVTMILAGQTLNSVMKPTNKSKEDMHSACQKSIDWMLHANIPKKEIVGRWHVPGVLIAKSNSAVHVFVTYQRGNG